MRPGGTIRVMKTHKANKTAGLRTLQIGATIALLYCAFAAQSQTDGGEFIQLKTILDEERGHCLDIAGAGANIDTLVPLQSHTCKRHFRDRSDELFIMNYPNKGNVYNAASEVCLDVVDHVELGTLYVRPCSDSPTQLFEFSGDGELKTAGMDTALCVTTAPSASHPAVRRGRTPEPGVTNVGRLVLLRPCDEVPDELKLWEFRS